MEGIGTFYGYVVFFPDLVYFTKKNLATLAERDGVQVGQRAAAAGLQQTTEKVRSDLQVNPAGSSTRVARWFVF
jgi:hypothetical protein